MYEYVKRCNRNQLMEGNAKSYTTFQPPLKTGKKMSGQPTIQCLLFGNATALWQHYKTLFVNPQAANFEQAFQGDSVVKNLFNEANQLLPNVDLTINFGTTGYGGLTSYQDTATVNACTISLDPGNSFEYTSDILMHELTHMIAHYSYQTNTGEQYSYREVTQTNPLIPGAQPVMVANKDANNQKRATDIRNWVTTQAQPQIQGLTANHIPFLSGRLQNIWNAPLTELDATLTDIIIYYKLHNLTLEPSYQFFSNIYIYQENVRKKEREHRQLGHPKPIP